VFQCYPPHFFWDKSIDGKCTVDPAKFFLVSVSTHLVIDVALIVFPASMEHTSPSAHSLLLMQKEPRTCRSDYSFAHF
jgi:hypothetical protein